MGDRSSNLLTTSVYMKRPLDLNQQSHRRHHNHIHPPLACVSIVDLSSEINLPQNPPITRFEVGKGQGQIPSKRRRNRHSNNASGDCKHRRRAEHVEGMEVQIADNGTSQSLDVDVDIQRALIDDGPTIPVIKLSRLFPAISQTTRRRRNPLPNEYTPRYQHYQQPQETLSMTRLNCLHGRRSKRGVENGRFKCEEASTQSDLEPNADGNMPLPHREEYADGLMTTDYDTITSDSLTLPRIEEVLRSEGVESLSITEQIKKLRSKMSRKIVNPPTHKYRSRGSLLEQNEESSFSKLPLSDSFGKQQPVTQHHDIRRQRFTLPQQTTLKPVTTITKPSPATTASIVPTTLSTGVANNSGIEQNLLDIAVKREQKTLDSYREDIERTRWLTAQHLEILRMGPDFVPPRIVSNVIRECIHKRADILPIVYDFELETFDSIIESLKSSLNTFKLASLAGSMLLVCRGGYDHLFILKKRVMTIQKLQKDNGSDLVRFWKQCSELISRINPENSRVDILSSYMLQPANESVSDRKRALQLTQQLSSVVYPNVIQFNLLDPSSYADRLQLVDYIDLEHYDKYFTSSEADVTTDATLTTAHHLPNYHHSTDNDVIEQVYRCNLPVPELTS